MQFINKTSIFGAIILAYLLINIRWLFVFSHVSNLLTPERYHGKYLTNNFFEGWYTKMMTIQPDGSLVSVAIIQGIYRPPDTEYKESTKNMTGAHAFIILIRSSYDEPLYYRYPIQDFVGDKEPLDPAHSYEISIGKSRFWNTGMSLDLDPKNLIWISDNEFKEYTRRTAKERIQFANKYSRSHIVTDNDILKSKSRFRRGTESFKRKINSTVIRGTLKFSNLMVLPKTFMDPAAMGVVYIIPFLECYHNILAMHMSVHGTINVGESEQIQFYSNTASGYIEKDHGYNFPTKYIWLQSNNFEDKGTTLLFSTAEIPILSRSSQLYKIISIIPYVGPYFQRITNPLGYIIKFLHPEIGLIGFDFLSSKITCFQTTHEDGNFQILNVTIVNSYYELRVSAKRYVGSGLLLRGPLMNARDMVLLVEETMDANITVTLLQKQRNEHDVDKIIFEGVGRCGGMEVVGDIENFDKSTTE